MNSPLGNTVCFRAGFCLWNTFFAFFSISCKRT